MEDESIKTGDMVMVIRNSGDPSLDWVVGRITIVLNGPADLMTLHYGLVSNAYELDIQDIHNMYGGNLISTRDELKKIKPLGEDEIDSVEKEKELELELELV